MPFLEGRKESQLEVQLKAPQGGAQGTRQWAEWDNTKKVTNQGVLQVHQGNLAQISL